MKSIAIVGGGTSGLIAALILKTKFQKTKIDIIKSDKIGIIGVGEGSTEHWLDFCNYVGITLQELLNEAGATFKYAVYFKGWTKEDYVHFVDGDWGAEHGNYYPLYGLAVSKKLKNKNIVADFIFKNKIAKNSFSNQFHFNTFKLNDFLIKKCKQKHINIIEDEIIKVKHSEKIECLISNKKKYRYDFYIDSTGFKKLLISSLSSKWISYNKYLPMNEAIAFPTPSTNDYDVYTLSEAMSSGWRWRIPTQDRWGNGYVFCNDFINASQAEEEISKKFNHKIEIAKNIKFNSGQLDRSWIKNCCAVGLSSSFLEPLEATAIGTTIQQMFLLTNYISSFSEKDIDQFNKYNSDITNNNLDFVLLHYLCKKSDTKFWKHITNNIKLTDTLSENLEKWKHRLPRKTLDINIPYTLFGPKNYILILNALNLFNTESIKKEYIKEMGTENKIIDKRLDTLLKMKYTLISHKEMINNNKINVL